MTHGRQHTWTHEPEISDSESLRYSCACGALGWRKGIFRDGQRVDSRIVAYKTGATLDGLKKKLEVREVTVQRTHPQSRSARAKHEAWGGDDWRGRERSDS